VEHACRELRARNASCAQAKSERLANLTQLSPRRRPSGSAWRNLRLSPRQGRNIPNWGHGGRPKKEGTFLPTPDRRLAFFWERKGLKNSS